jgi:hypothetical protein
VLYAKRRRLVEEVDEEGNRIEAQDLVERTHELHELSRVVMDLGHVAARSVLQFDRGQGRHLRERRYVDGFAMQCGEEAFA